MAPSEVAALERLVRRATSEQRLVQRAKLALLLQAQPTVGNTAAAAQLGQHPNWVRKWRKRWAQAGFAVAALVTPADVMENTPMLDLLWPVSFRWKLRPCRAVGDTTYGTGENIRALEETGICAYVPLPDFDQASPFFGKQDFLYDPARDVYTCPGGAVLRYRGNSYSAPTRAGRCWASWWLRGRRRSRAPERHRCSLSARRAERLPLFLPRAEDLDAYLNDYKSSSPCECIVSAGA